MASISKVSRNRNGRTLVLVDHDGTLCDTNPSAYESIKYAFKQALDNIKSKNNLEVDWNKIFDETRGTTEKNVVRYLCYSFNIPYSKSVTFEERFYYFREKWYENSRKLGEYVWDTYYPDTHQLVTELSSKSKYVLWLLTGNPHNVINQRISNSMRIVFEDKKTGELKGVFGEEAYTRTELIQIALKKAEKENPGFSVVKDSMGFTINVCYIADSRSDFFAGIEAKVKTLWIPSRSLQENIEVQNQDYVKFITKTLGDRRVLVVNDLYTDRVKEFIG